MVVVMKMQPPYVMAFRKRLYNRGYREIKISRFRVDGILYWHVSALEPLSETRVWRLCSVDFLCNKFR